MDQKELWTFLQDPENEATATLTKPVVLRSQRDPRTDKRVEAGGSVSVVYSSPFGYVVVSDPENRDMAARIQCVPSESIENPKEILTDIAPRKRSGA